MASLMFWRSTGPTWVVDHIGKGTGPLGNVAECLRVAGQNILRCLLDFGGGGESPTCSSLLAVDGGQAPASTMLNKGTFAVRLPMSEEMVLQAKEMALTPIFSRKWITVAKVMISHFPVLRRAYVWHHPDRRCFLWAAAAAAPEDGKQHDSFD